ncbi:MAG: hypothetical protein EXX96DRAFT_587099 [Benjaminiella poitrasii]|nr:MAG: hypothetical protein EXX96DRAFT_587099 [Benjaminiella poitrasii]
MVSSTTTVKSNSRQSAIALKMTPTTIRKGAQQQQLSSSTRTKASESSGTAVTEETKKRSSPLPPNLLRINTASLGTDKVKSRPCSATTKGKPHTAGLISNGSINDIKLISGSPTTISSTKSLPTQQQAISKSSTSYATRRANMISPPPSNASARPDFSHVKSKIGSLENIKHKPNGGAIKIFDEKVGRLKHRIETKVKPKVGSKENIKHKPGGGQVQIFDDKAAFIKTKSISPKVGSKDNIKHKPGGGQVKIYDDKATFIKSKEIKSKVGSFDNVKHKPGGGDLVIYNEKLTFHETASPKIDAGGSSQKRSRKQGGRPGSSSGASSLAESVDGSSRATMISPFSLERTISMTSTSASLTTEDHPCLESSEEKIQVNSPTSLIP